MQTGRRVVAPLGYACNNHCRMCLHGDARDRVTIDTAEAVEQRLRDEVRRGDTVILTGGEPTLMPTLPRLARLARELGAERIDLETNARLFAHEPNARRTLSWGVDLMVVSLQAHIAELGEYITRTPGSFDQTVTGIRHLRTAGLAVATKTVILRQNYRHLPSIAALALNLGVGETRWVFPRIEGSLLSEFVRLTPRFVLVEPYLREVAALTAQRSAAMWVEHAPLCALHGLLDHQAEKQSPVTVWADSERNVTETPSSRRELLKSYGEPCEACVVRERCEGVWKPYVDEYGWSEFETIEDAASL